MTRTPVTYPKAWPAYSCAAITGRMELAVGEAVSEPLNRAYRVTAILSALLATVDEARATPALIRRLASGTREWLLFQLAALCRPVPDWYEVACAHCATKSDLLIDLADLPRSPASQEFPVVTVPHDGQELAFEVPNGHTEEFLAGVHRFTIDDLRRVLESLALNNATVNVLQSLDDTALRSLETAIDMAAPACAQSVQSRCPGCRSEITAEIDPLTYAFPSERSVLRDVHALGRAYNWSEADILKMPMRRRKTYIGLIAGDGGRR